MDDEPAPLFDQPVCLARDFLLPAPRLHVRDWPGRRGPLLCLPDVGQDGAVFDQLAHALAPAWRVLVVDPRGQGGSSPLRPGAGRQVHVDDVRALLDLLGLSGVVLAGVGDGARLALLVAVLEPARIDGVILLVPTGADEPEIR